MTKNKNLMDISVRLPQVQITDLLQIAEQDGISLDELLKDIVQDHLEPEENPNENPEG